ncbi:hypothetical protein FGO68_gene2466 [Halteria grandinella]|uniref:RING-type domain-containing protein n=1 Tax=Halteria grandinella TaxID=5974 RepID=A0A8J8T698_HALGN|nr:hypothetical protein FGO68_gene2466 [Halteria grandinella]
MTMPNTFPRTLLALLTLSVLTFAQSDNQTTQSPPTSSNRTFPRQFTLETELKYTSLLQVYNWLQQNSTSAPLASPSALGSCNLQGSFIILLSCTGLNQSYIVESGFMIGQIANATNGVPQFFRAINNQSGYNDRWIQSTDLTSFNYLAKISKLNATTVEYGINAIANETGNYSMIEGSLREGLIKGFDYNATSFYKKTFYDGKIYVVENATDYNQKTSMSSLLIYKISQTNSTSLPGSFLTSLNVTKRWPSWEIQKTGDQTYQIYYTKMNQYNQTLLVSTRIYMGNSSLIQTIQSEDFGQSCQPSSSISLEVTQRFIIMKCNDLHVYSRDKMKILTITKFPDVERTISLELGQQVMIFGTLYGRLYLAELLVKNSSDLTSSGTQPDVTFDLGYEYRTVVNSIQTFSLQRWGERQLVMRYDQAPDQTFFFTYETCNMTQYRVNYTCQPCLEQQFTLWFGQDYCHRCSDYNGAMLLTMTQFRREKILANCKNITMNIFDPNFSGNTTTGGGGSTNQNTTTGNVTQNNQTQEGQSPPQPPSPPTNSTPTNDSTQNQTTPPPPMPETNPNPPDSFNITISEDTSSHSSAIKLALAITLPLFFLLSSVICCYVLYKYKLKRNAFAVKKHIHSVESNIISTMRQMTVARESNVPQDMMKDADNQNEQPLEVMIEDFDYIKIEGLNVERDQPSMESMERMNSQSTNKSTGRIMLDKSEPFCKNTTTKIKFKKAKINKKADIDGFSGENVQEANLRRQKKSNKENIVPVLNTKIYNFQDPNTTAEHTKSITIQQEPFDYNTWRSSHRTDHKDAKPPTFRPPQRKQTIKLNESLSYQIQIVPVQQSRDPATNLVLHATTLHDMGTMKTKFYQWQCCVCLEDFDELADVRRTRCEHLFHFKCLVKAVQMHWERMRDTVKEERTEVGCPECKAVLMVGDQQV